MSVVMGIRDRRTGEYRTIPVSASQVFRDYWIPASEALGLRLVSHLHDATLFRVQLDQIPVIVDELRQLRDYAVARHDFAFIVERIDMISAALSATDASEYDYSFG